jgi:uncharacterized membrane protein
LPRPVEPAPFISKSRLDALTDGVYAFAMTLLVVNIELPDGFDPKSNRELLSGLAALADTFTAYVITFLVLASFWLGRARAEDGPEMESAAYAWASILHLFPVTFMPFAMLLAGRLDFPAAIWVYGANMILLALSAMGILYVGEGRNERRRLPQGTIELSILIASALLSMALAWVTPGNAMLAYLLNLATPFVAPALYRR